MVWLHFLPRLTPWATSYRALRALTQLATDNWQLRTDFKWLTNLKIRNFP